MTHQQLSRLNNEELARAVHALSATELQQQVTTLAKQQVTTVVQSLNADEDFQWEEKLPLAIASINGIALIEAAGTALTAEQSLLLLKCRNEKVIKQLPSLFVGMPYTTFDELLLIVGKEELETLKHEGCTEPLQHQVTLFSHQMEQEIANFVAYLQNLEEEIDSLNPATMNFRILEAIFELISNATIEATGSLSKLDNALAIAWNTEREDLIATLSFQKESWQKYLTLAIGTLRHGDQPASGLYARLEQHLSRIFSNPDTPEDIEALHDDEPAIEALAKLSIWYLHDYWEIGLLPAITDPNDLDLDSQSHSVSDRFNYRAGLFSEAQQQLQDVGLTTVKDLKREHIYSKAMLIEFIAKNQER